VVDRAIIAAGDRIEVTGRPLAETAIDPTAYDWLVSYGYKAILRPAALAAVNGRAVNLHISLLPWNRGMHPNVWSIVEGTPTGVSLHLIDDGIDTGALIAQRPVKIQDTDTLASSYNQLRRAVEDLFADWWPRLRTGDYQPTPQPVGGSHHYARELATIADLMPVGWDTPVAEVRRRAATRRLS
jgi:methionyl-tRNA formyltransferase